MRRADTGLNLSLPARIGRQQPALDQHLAAKREPANPPNYLSYRPWFASQYFLVRRALFLETNCLADHPGCMTPAGLNNDYGRRANRPIAANRGR